MKKFLLAAVACLAFQGPVETKEVTVTKADHEQTVNLESGDTLFVVVQGNPTTGYTWEVKSNDESVLKMCSKTYKPLNPGVCGSPGIFTFTFRPTLKKGTSDLALEYARSWEKGVPPISTLHVIVKSE
jgi:inhibitor of cysteine peptidase